MVGKLPSLRILGGALCPSLVHGLYMLCSVGVHCVDCTIPCTDRFALFFKSPFVLGCRCALVCTKRFVLCNDVSRSILPLWSLATQVPNISEAVTIPGSILIRSVIKFKVWRQLHYICDACINNTGKSKDMRENGEIKEGRSLCRDPYPRAVWLG